MNEQVLPQFKILCVIPYEIFYDTCKYLFDKNQVDVLEEV